MEGDKVTVHVYATGMFATDSQTYALAWDKALEQVPCEVECNSLSPPFQCLVGEKIGSYPCVNNTYHSTCTLPCEEKNTHRDLNGTCVQVYEEGGTKRRKL